MKEEGIDPIIWLKEPVLTPGIQRVVGRLLNEADRLYQQSSVGVADLAQDCRAAIYSARLIYAEIGQHLRAHQLDSINQRSVVPMSRKLWLLCQAKIQAPWIVTAKQPSPALDAIDYLVKACEEQCAIYDLKPEGFPNRGFPQRVEWVLELIERRLEEEQSYVRPMNSNISPLNAQFGRAQQVSNQRS
jgi:phytoene synthase